MTRIIFGTVLTLTAITAGVFHFYPQPIQFPRAGYTSVWTPAAPVGHMASGSAAR